MDLGSLIRFVVYLTLLGVIGSRLLDVRRPWLVKVAASFFGMLLGIIFTLSVTVQNPARVALLLGPDRAELFSMPDFVLMLTISALVATMSILLLFELLIRPGNRPSVPSVGIPRPIRAIRARFARIRRYTQIVRIATRYGLTSFFGQPRAPLSANQPINASKIAGNLRAALEEAGGVFIKLGQVLSIRADLIGPDFAAELTGLQDNVSPVPPALINTLFVEEFGKPPDQIFAEFSTQPIAAASIAQAYSARLPSGDPVIVKVQRPAVRALVERDLDILLRLARTVEARTAWGKAFRVVELAERFAVVLREELDFKIEAQNIHAVAAATKSQAKVRIPKVYSSLSTARVLVLEQFEGVSIREAGSLISTLEIEPIALARELLRFMLYQILFEGTFHADPHPGNVMVLRNGQLALIDFGLVGRLDPLQQIALRRTWIALERRNAIELSDAILQVAEAREGVDEYALERGLAQFMAQRLGPGMEANATLFTALFQLLRKFGLGFSPEISGVFRALVTLDGTLKQLAPEFQLLTEARTLAAEWLQEALMPQAIVPTAIDELRTMLPVLMRLPKRLDHIANLVEHGTFSTNIRLFADERDTRFILSVVANVLFAFLGATIGIISAILLGITNGPTLTTNISLPHAFGYVGLFISAILMMRVVISLVRTRAPQ